MNKPDKYTPAVPNAFIFAGLFFAFPGWIANMPPLLWPGLFFVVAGVLMRVIFAIRNRA